MCFLTLCERNFNRKLAYRFLEDLSQEFYSLYGQRISTATRPYSFIEFDTYIQKAKRTYADSRGNRNLNALNNELQDVQRIMVQNIDDVLQRGAVLSGGLTRSCSPAAISAKRLHLEFGISLSGTAKECSNCLSFTELESKSQNLSMMSAKYKKDAATLNSTTWLAIGGGVTVLFFCFFIWFKFL